MPVVVLVKANVTSYDHWRTAYDAHAGFRRESGVNRDEVYCSPEDMTFVLVLHYFDTVEAATTFVSDPALAEAMRASGVIGAPHITITQII
jgi:hypothetical protein